MLRAVILAAARVMFGASAHVSGHARSDAGANCATASEATADFMTDDVGK